MTKCDFTVRAAKLYGKAQYTYAIPVIVRDGNVSPMHKGEKINWCYIEEPNISFDPVTCLLTIGTQSVSLKGSCYQTDCVAPVVISPANVTLQQGVIASVARIITVANATSASISNLPDGLTQVTTLVGTSAEISISGMPTASASYVLVVDANNDCATGENVSVTNLAGGTILVTPAPCATPTI